MRVICKNCGKPFRRNATSLRKAKLNFCCRECYWEYRAKHHYGYMAKKEIANAVK